MKREIKIQKKTKRREKKIRKKTKGREKKIQKRKILIIIRMEERKK
jgi:hypothetical protein